MLGPRRTRGSRRPEIALHVCECIREAMIDRFPAGGIDGVRAIVQRVDAIHGVRREEPRRIRRNLGRVELQLLGQRHAAVVQAPHKQKREVHRRRQHNGADDHVCQDLQPTRATAARDIARQRGEPSNDEGDHQRVDEREGDQVRRRRQTRLKSQIRAV